VIFFVSDGRLGNQVFQYAFLNTTAKKGEKVVCANMNQFPKYFNYRNKNFIFLKNSKIALFVFNFFLSKILSFLASLKLIGYIEQTCALNSILPEVSIRKGLLPFTYVKTGFFQTEKLFKSDNAGLSIDDTFIRKAKLVLQKLPMDKKVFIHVRRGDYLLETFQGEKGINLPKQYYIDAINEIRKSVVNPYFIFLTDDPGYVKDCFIEIENKLVSEECMGTDLAIMSLCQYGVVSNSSFSWWGAYLSQNKKVMIFPKYWYGWKKKVESHVGIQPSWSTVIDVRKVSK